MSSPPRALTDRAGDLAAFLFERVTAIRAASGPVIKKPGFTPGFSAMLDRAMLDRATIFPGLCGQTNQDALMSWSSHVGIAMRTDMDERTVCQITKAFWDNINQVSSDAALASAGT